MLSRDGHTLHLGSEHGIYVIDAATLSVRAHWLATTSFMSMALSPDGGYLFAATMDSGVGQLEQVDRHTGGLVVQVQVPLTILGLERVRAG